MVEGARRWSPDSVEWSGGAWLLQNTPKHPGAQLPWPTAFCIKDLLTLTQQVKGQEPQNKPRGLQPSEAMQDCTDAGDGFYL